MITEQFIVDGLRALGLDKSSAVIVHSSLRSFGRVVCVSHTANTAIHLAEQRLGRSRFFRYAKAANGVWMELPNVPGCSDSFDAIEPDLLGATREVFIGPCRARQIPLAAILAAVERRIRADPRALLCPGTNCRCQAAYEQRLAWIAAQKEG